MARLFAIDTPVLAIPHASEIPALGSIPLYSHLIPGCFPFRSEIVLFHHLLPVAVILNQKPQQMTPTNPLQ
jgi:hypothetical protein